MRKRRPRAAAAITGGTDPFPSSSSIHAAATSSAYADENGSLSTPRINASALHVT